MILKIKYLGYSCFLFETYDGVKVITDPYNDSVGYTMPKIVEADVVLVSHAHPAHCCIDIVKGSPAIIQGEGQRELNWIKINGINSYHDSFNGKNLGINTIFCWDMRAVRFCHLGDLGHRLSERTISEIGKVDVLLIPIGGKTTVSLTEVEDLIEKIDCKYIIPMKYRTVENQEEINDLNDFIHNKKNIIVPKKKNEFRIDRKNITINKKKIVVLEYVPG
ncbi:MBL fold metallo-hydrolase [bacterium]|nr:MBL fold metallo-hydrolase [bacterium]